MQVKSTFLLIFTLLSLCGLSACGHYQTKRTTESNPNTDTANTVEPQTSAKPAANTENNAPALGSAVTGTLSTPVASSPTVYVSIFDRIRDGFQFPEFSSKHVTHYEKWNSQHPTYLNNLFERAEPFLFYIVEEIEKRDLPMELALLPAVESAFKTTAYSRSGAAGLWQFIPSTGRHFKLRQDWWYDGRRDVIESTNAALDYLTQLNKDFKGDWFLALAAYNAGGGTLRKAIRRNKKLGKNTQFQDLTLRSETARYVPKLIALKNIINQPEKFKVSLPSIANEVYFARIDIPRQIDLSQFAENAQINKQELSNLNAGFLRWATSPLGPNRLLVPVQKKQLAQSAVIALKQTPFIKFKHHKVIAGDTLSGIAKKYRVSVNALKQTNKLSNTNIRVGRSLMIPLQAKQYLTTSTETPNTKLIHRVKRGDTLWSIARRYQVKVKQLLSWNQLSSNHILSLNQSVLIYSN